MDERIVKIIGRASKKPGVYIWKKDSGKILYVGKADNLRNRLRNYLNPRDIKTKKLVEEADIIETIVTSTGVEALILEDALVKQNQPRYNVRLRDDKRYPYIRVTVEDEFPRILIVRRVEAQRSRYFGPYVDARDIRKVISLVGEFFGICKCKRDHNQMKRPCLNHSLGICVGPKTVVDKKHYRRLVEQACSFLSGDHSRVIRSLTLRMKDASASKNYEKALMLRDNIQAIKNLAIRQDISGSRLPDMDILGYASSGKRSNICQLQVRSKKVIAVLHHSLKGEYSLDPKRSMKAFIKQHYFSADMIPQLIVTSDQASDRELLEHSLATAFGKKIEINTAMRGQKRKLTDLAVKNSIHQLEQERLEKMAKDPLNGLQEIFRLSRPPRRIEGYDISNLGDRDTVGSMVVFANGKPDKGEYRMFSVKGKGANDPRNMSEVIGRRFKHDEWQTPDIVLLDGGKAQLSACKSKVPKGVLLISLAKRDEEIFVVDRKRPIILQKNDTVLHLLQAVRDEAHRFGKRYHTIKMGKRFLNNSIH